MILECKQVERLPRRLIKFYDKTLEIGHAEAKRGFISDATVFDRTYHIEEDETPFSFGIFVGGKKLGAIKEDIVVTKKILFIPIGYSFYRFLMNSIEYRVYLIGLGPDMNYFFIYKGDEVVAAIHKDDLVINYKDTYTLYSLDNDSMELAMIFTLFLETTSYLDTSSGLGNDVSDISTYTVQKELKEKYDPSFIERVISLER